MEQEPSLNELEKRMRPGGCSTKGFLGPTESLEAVLSRDEQTLQRLNLTFDQLADGLAFILRDIDGQIKTLVETNRDEYFRREELTAWNGTMPILENRVESLPGPEIGYLVGDHYQVFRHQFRGLQECPWGCEYDKWASFDFLLLNLKTGKLITAPGLIVHLIREHHFFEGLESPYRVDPLRLARVLELAASDFE